MLEMMDEEDRVGTAVEETKAEIAFKLLKRGYSVQYASEGIGISWSVKENA